MLKISPSLCFPDMPRIGQTTPYYCGPAVMEMLLKYQNVQVDQHYLVEISGVAYKIKEHGMLLSEMAQTINSMPLGVKFWYKRDSTMRELSMLVNQFNCPVGVEWQGLFDYEDDEEEDDDDDEGSTWPYDEEDDDDDPGHYSVVTYCSTQENVIMMADPDLHYSGTDRQFSVLEFERRWWDINQVKDKYNGRMTEVDDYHACFIIVPETEIFPVSLGMTMRE